MLNHRGSSLVTTILSIAAAAGVGVAGFSLVNGGLGGSCSAGLDANATVVADGSTCPITGKTLDVAMVSNEAKGDCCELGESAAEATLVAAEGEACSTEKTSCSTEATTLVAAEGETCLTEKTSCSTEAATLVAAEGEACSTEKAEGCEKADDCCGSDCEKACESSAGEIASAE